MKNKEMGINTISLMSMVMGSDAITYQEREGQKNLCNSSELPMKYNGGLKEQKEYIEKLNQMGITVIETEEERNKNFADGELFMKVILPEGWSIKRTDHSMWSNLTDNKGKKRASIFYKAAFYDRDAFINFNRRFSISYKIADYDEKKFEHQPEYIKTEEVKKVWVDENDNEY